MGNIRHSLKQQVRKILESHNLDAALRALSSLPPMKVVNALFPFLYSCNDNLKWGAITAMGETVRKIAQDDMESARVVVRRLMWNLNDESGGIGWGSAEAMGEILALDNGLAEEYASILVSYIKKDANFQEHELMQRGVLWAIGRLAQTSPELVRGSVPHIISFLQSNDPVKRGLAAWIMGLLKIKEARQALVPLLDDGTRFMMYNKRKLVNTAVKDVALSAMMGVCGEQPPISSI